MEEVRAAQFGGAFVTAVERHEGGTSPLPSFRPSNYNIGPPLIHPQFPTYKHPLPVKCDLFWTGAAEMAEADHFNEKCELVLAAEDVSKRTCELLCSV